MKVEAATGVCRIDFARKVDEFDKRAANLPKGEKKKKSQTAGAKTRIESKQQEERRGHEINPKKDKERMLDAANTANTATYIYCDMADDGCVVWQADITRLVMRRTDSAVVAAVLRRRRGIRIDDEGALDVDLDAARTGDGAVNLFRRGHGARPFGCAPGLLLVVDIVSALLIALSLQLVMVVWRGCRHRLVGRYKGRHCRLFALLFFRSASSPGVFEVRSDKEVEDANQKDGRTGDGLVHLGESRRLKVLNLRRTNWYAATS